VPDGRVCQTLANCQADPDYWGYLINQRVLATTTVNRK